MTQDQEKTLQQAIRQNGANRQLDILIEEMAELTQAILKARRAGLIKDWGIPRPTIEDSMETITKYNNLCEETADVENALNQLKMMLDKANVKHFFDMKVERLQASLDKEKEESCKK